ncbi:MAG: hypothetical protein AAEI92_07795 [Arenicellales bacterium]
MTLLLFKLLATPCIVGVAAAGWMTELPVAVLVIVLTGKPPESRPGRESH